MPIVYTNWRIRTCSLHELQYNAEHGGCPVCIDENVQQQLAAAAPRRYSPLRFTCPYCGARSIYNGCCSSYGCRRRAGLTKPRFCVNRCVLCGGKTKYAEACTKYPCRQKSGRAGMYYRPV